METIRSSETSVLTTTTQHQIPENDFLHIHRRENLKSYIVFLYKEVTHLKMEAIHSSETSVLTTTKRHQIPEDDFLQTIPCFFKVI
jgi:hypothetical protein